MELKRLFIGKLEIFFGNLKFVQEFKNYFNFCKSPVVSIIDSRLTSLALLCIFHSSFRFFPFSCGRFRVKKSISVLFYPTCSIHHRKSSRDRKKAAEKKNWKMGKQNSSVSLCLERISWNEVEKNQNFRLWKINRKRFGTSRRPRIKKQDEKYSEKNIAKPFVFLPRWTAAARGMKLSHHRSRPGRMGGLRDLSILFHWHERRQRGNTKYLAISVPHMRREEKLKWKSSWESVAIY